MRILGLDHPQRRFWTELIYAALTGEETVKLVYIERLYAEWLSTTQSGTLRLTLSASG